MQGTVRSLVAEEEKLSMELRDLERWLKHHQKKLTHTIVIVNFNYDEEVGNGETRKAELYGHGITREYLVKLVNEKLEERIKTKQTELSQIRRQLKYIDDKLGVITL